MVKPVPVLGASPTVQVQAPRDATVERLKQLQVWQLAYCRDVVIPLKLSIKPIGLAPGTMMVGRAYTVDGPEVYLNALEGIGPGEVYVQANCSEVCMDVCIDSR